MSALSLDLADRATRSRAAEGTQAALVLLAGGSEEARPHHGAPWPCEAMHSAEAKELAALAARLRVGGLVAPPPVADEFVRGLERRLAAAWPEGAKAPTIASVGEESSHQTMHETPRPLRVGQSAGTGTAIWIQRLLRLRTGGRARAVFHGHLGRASISLAALTIALAWGGLSSQGEALMNAPTHTPTVGAAKATPSPGPGTGLDESSRVPEAPWHGDDAARHKPPLLIARAGQGSEPKPAPAPRSTPRADRPTG
jgi:hypothetical protein